MIGCAAKANAKAPEKAPAADGSSFNQLLGIKGAKQESVSLPSTSSRALGIYCTGWLWPGFVDNWVLNRSTNLRTTWFPNFHALVFTMRKPKLLLLRNQINLNVVSGLLHSYTLQRRRLVGSPLSLLTGECGYVQTTNIAAA